MGIHSEAELNRKFVEFAKLLNVYLNHFPKIGEKGTAKLRGLPAWPCKTYKFVILYVENFEEGD